MVQNLNIENRAVSDLLPYINNPKAHPEAQIDKIASSIKNFGFLVPIVIDGQGEIIAGHGRLLAAKKLGLESAPCVMADHLTPAQVKAFRIADNKMAESDWFPESLIAELKSLEEMAFDLSLTGFDLEELEGFGIGQGGDPAPEDPGPQIDRAAELQEKWGTARGQIWQVGRHRVMCGDSTSAEDVGRLLEGKKADLCLTDPPYGVGLDYATTDDTAQNVSDIAKLWLPIAKEMAKVVVFSPGVTGQWLYPEPDWVLCWFYGGGQLRSPWGFNCWQPFLCYGKDPSLASGKGCRPDAVDMNTPANAADIDHPCPKPMKLWEWMIGRLSLKDGELFYDPFLGSGTTLIAAEQLGRICHGMEIAPEYVAVILERATGIGLEPKLVN